MLKTYVFCALFALALTSCATVAQKQSDAIFKHTQIVDQHISVCISETDRTPALGAVYEYMLQGNDDPRRVEKMADPRLITDDMRQQLIQASALIAKCRQIHLEGYGSVHPALHNIIEVRNAAKDTVTVELLSGKISIGEANQAIVYVDSLYNQAFGQVTQSLSTQLAQADAGEREGRRQRWLNFSMAMQQYQQQLQAQQQQQQMQNTNCNVYGNRISCHSY